MKHLLGFDIGGTKTEVTLFELGGDSGEFQVSVNAEVLNITNIASKRMPTSRVAGYESYLKNLSDLINSVLAEKSIELNALCGMGIGLPGSVHPETGKMLNGNTKMLIGKEFVKDLRAITKYDGKISVNNDASCFALAEALCGAGLKYEADHGIPVSRQQSIGIILGTGCGGGLINSGKILNGAKGGGGEIGHTTLITNGHSCYCGRSGCAEQYLCGPALEASMATKLGIDSEKAPGASEIFKLYSEGDPAALEVVDDYRDKLTDFLINLNNIYDPHFFVLGGGVSKQEIIYKGLEEKIGKKMFVCGKVPNIFKHQLSDSAGVLGAAIMVL